MATQNQILKTAKTIDFLFDEFTRSARQEKLKAKFRGDMKTHARIDAAWREARDSKEAALGILEDQLLSDAVTNEIVEALQSQQQKARGFLDNIRAANKILETIENVAELATTTLSRVSAIAGG